MFDIGYIFSFVIAGYNIVALIICFIYVGLEPIKTWYRLRNMRKAQIALAKELREFLIRDAKMRKERRKQKKLA